MQNRSKMDIAWSNSHMTHGKWDNNGKLRALTLAACVGTSLVLAGCNTSQVMSHGYQVNEETLALVPAGSSREQALLSLGTPSTTLKQQDGTETFYYISQKKARSMAFVRAKVVDQRVLAVYFNKEGNIDHISNYGMQDGKVFDFVRRVTPTGGKELSFLSQLLGAAGAVTTPLGGGTSG